MSAYQPDNKKIPLFETFCRKQQVDGKTIRAKICGVPLDLKVATTPRSQAKGFTGAKSAPKENEGIIFVYDKASPLSFWMKGVPFELDIVFFNDDREYLEHFTMGAHSDEHELDLPKYSSKEPARFAVELPAGWCKKHLKKDASLEF